MLGFLQGLAYGLFVTCLPWFLIGMASPRLALAELDPNRIQVIVRYWLLVPFVAFVFWLTSLWGGFDPSLAGWLVGLVAIAVELPLERRARNWWQRWRARRRARRQAAEDSRQRAERQREAQERGGLSLDPEHPPADADEVVRALCAAKGDFSIESDKDKVNRTLVTMLGAKADYYEKQCDDLTLSRILNLFTPHGHQGQNQYHQKIPKVFH